jgi:hypothetical protein
MTSTMSAERTALRRTAKIITDVLSPAALATLMLFLVPIRAAGLMRGLAWGAFAVAFVSAAPLAYVILRVRRRTLTDVHIGAREQRRVPFTVGLVTVVVGLVLLVVTGAPRLLIALVVAFLALTAAIIAITHWWKVSVHAMVAMMTVGVLAATYGKALLVSVVAVPVIGWARVELRDHTVRQVLAGAAVGLGIAGLFALMR